MESQDYIPALPPSSVDAERSVVLEGVQPTLFKVSIPYLQTDEAQDVILKVADGIRPD